MQAVLLDAGQRRLLAAAENTTTVAITVEAKYTGSQTGSKNVVDKLDRLEEAQCTVPGLCDNLGGALLRRSWTDPAAVQGGTLALTVQSVNESSIVVRGVYSEGGITPVDMPIFIVLEDQDVRLPCVPSLDGVARLLTCVGPLASNITLKWTTTAPNTVVLAEPLATSVTYTCESGSRTELSAMPSSICRLLSLRHSQARAHCVLVFGGADFLPCVLASITSVSACLPACLRSCPHVCLCSLC